MFAELISAALRGPIGRAGGGPAGAPGSGAFGHGLIPAGGPTRMFSGWFSHSESGSANFAPDGSKFVRTPDKVDITMAESSSKVDLLKFEMVTKFESMSFCSLVIVVIENIDKC